MVDVFVVLYAKTWILALTAVQFGALVEFRPHPSIAVLHSAARMATAIRPQRAFVVATLHLLFDLSNCDRPYRTSFKALIFRGL